MRVLGGWLFLGVVLIAGCQGLLGLDEDYQPASSVTAGGSPTSSSGMAGSMSTAGGIGGAECVVGGHE